MNTIGRPVLIGTTSIEKSELLAKILDNYKLQYNLLNAKPENINREAEIISQAGRQYALTISTNMAGRGKDIILGGNPKFITRMMLIDLIKEKIYKIKRIKINKLEEYRKIILTLNSYIDHIWGHSLG